MKKQIVLLFAAMMPPITAGQHMLGCTTEERMAKQTNPMNGPEPKRKPRPVRDEDWDEFAKREPAMRKRETDKAPLFRKGDDGR